MIKIIGEDVWSHFGMWEAVIVWIVIYSIFLLFTPFYKKSQIKPTGVYMAFIVAFAIEMFGVPFSMFAIGWLFGFTLPEGIFWGHTLGNYIGLWGMYVGIIVSLAGAALVILGWNKIHKDYWSKETGQGELVKTGIYKYIRHPQYTGFFMITLGMMFEWATLPLIILYCAFIVIYYKLAKREENDMVKEFGDEYIAYRKKTKMFIPYVV
ncbi:MULTISPECIES: methyltransferase family protein [Methanobacterium]|uniref:Isoprenylcysteine carboxylmethyltransferase family protein n=2 Tax=Methanobacterium veterum TaxID=408577 RepID=A0A9E5A0V1_9EURY|nr:MULTISPECIES: isoprenylcysteine carboxylmethyltransferase family protein [Methanobacterium]MCZ3371061.1 isoprenylcysteine carboxylmethyltransferase family protein [Methanobacterium veterum]